MRNPANLVELHKNLVNSAKSITFAHGRLWRKSRKERRYNVNTNHILKLEN